MFKPAEADQFQPARADPEFIIAAKFIIPFIFSAALQFIDIRGAWGEADKVALSAKTEKFECTVDVEDITVVGFQIVTAGKAGAVAAVPRLNCPCIE